MKQNNSGFSLVEIVVAIAILGLFAVSTCTSLVLGLRMNEKTEAMLNAQLAVSSAVETLMAEGITSDTSIQVAKESALENAYNVSIELTKEVDADSYYKVVVTSNNAEVVVSTFIREVS